MKLDRLSNVLLVLLLDAATISTAQQDDDLNLSIVNLGETCDSGNSREQTITIEEEEKPDIVMTTNDLGEEVGGQRCKTGDDGMCISTGKCEDRNENCYIWAASGECGANAKFMLNFCKKSCEICDFDGDLGELVVLKGRLDQVGGDETLLENPYGMNQTFWNNNNDGSPSYEDTLKQTSHYMETIIFQDPKYESTIRHTCKNRHRSCAKWTTIGECEENPTYMQKQCAPSCRSCHALDPTFKCPIDENAPKALPSEGSLNALFERIVADGSEFQKYNPTILSQPENDGPWVVTLENFVSDDECDRLIQLGNEMGYERSADTGKRKFDGSHEKSINNGRTSTNTFCFNECESDPATQAVTNRIEQLTGVPSKNYEFLQLLRYEPGQFYQTHHDYAQYHNERPFGPRIITVFLYLNDVEEGGATAFPNLGFEVTPAKGKVLLWPSVQDANPQLIDIRTRHGAINVTKGIKYAANAWLHQGDFKSAHAKGCV